MWFWQTQLGELRDGLVAYLLTSTLVWLGVCLGIDFVSPHRVHPNTPKPNFLTACSRFDGFHYASIAERGYAYDPQQRSEVAFFPAYPLTAQLAIALTGCNARLALLVTSNLMLFGVFVVFSAYLHSRYPHATKRSRLLVLGLFGLWPAGFFFRMTYSESTFLFFTLLVLCGMVRSWSLPVLALFAGLATAARPVGLAVTAALLWHILSDADRGSIARRVFLAILVSPFATWGLLAYMTYQYYIFDTPIAFAQTEKHWNYVGQSHTFAEKVESLLAGEPIWGVYTSDPLRDWKRIDHHDHFLFSLVFWNPILFVVALILVLFGAAKSWLSGAEVVLGLGLLAIPYVTRAYEMSMLSHARFAAVDVPAYLVMGRILGSLPAWVTWCVFGLLSPMLMAWSALFAAGYLLF